MDSYMEEMDAVRDLLTEGAQLLNGMGMGIIIGGESDCGHPECQGPRPLIHPVEYVTALAAIVEGLNNIGLGLTGMVAHMAQEGDQMAREYMGEVIAHLDASGLLDAMAETDPSAMQEVENYANGEGGYL